MNYIIILFIGLAASCKRQPKKICYEKKYIVSSASSQIETLPDHTYGTNNRSATTDQLYWKLASLNAEYPHQRLEMTEIQRRVNKALQEAGQTENVRSTIMELLNGPTEAAKAVDEVEVVKSAIKLIARGAEVIAVASGFVFAPVISIVLDLMMLGFHNNGDQWNSILNTALGRVREFSYREKIMGYYTKCNSVTLSLNGMEVDSIPMDHFYGKLNGILPDTIGTELMGQLEGYISHTLPQVNDADEANRLLDMVNQYCYAYFWRVHLLLRKYGLLQHFGYNGTAVRNNIRHSVGTHRARILEFLYTPSGTRSEAVVTSVFYSGRWSGIDKFLSMNKIQVPTYRPWEEQVIENSEGFLTYGCGLGICVVAGGGGGCVPCVYTFFLQRECTIFQFKATNCEGHQRFILALDEYEWNVVLVPLENNMFLIANPEYPDYFLGPSGRATYDEVGVSFEKLSEDPISNRFQWKLNLKD